MTKLIIQIPCYNEEECISETIKSLPKKIDGIDEIEILIINDGSTDDTLKTVESLKVNHIKNLYNNSGLGVAFSCGIKECLNKGADIIVNTDADNQYNSLDIEKLVKPILDEQADIVIGDRPIFKHEEFSKIKKILQKVGTYVVKSLTKTNINDAPSGFRALNRKAAKKIRINNTYSYTIEMIIQASIKNLKIISIPIRVNAAKRPSRLIKSIPNYIFRNILIILDVYFRYNARKIFTLLSLICLTFGTLIGTRFLYFYLIGEGTGKVQSLIFSSILFGGGFTFFIMAMLSELISTNRKLIEEVLDEVS